MKDFQDFIDSLDSESVDSVIASAVSIAETDERKMFFISLQLLNLYHSWIQQNEPSQET